MGAGSRPTPALQPHHEKAGPVQCALCLFIDDRELIRKAVSKEKANAGGAKKYGDVFALSLEAARYALSCGEDVSEIFLTKPWTANAL